MTLANKLPAATCSTPDESLTSTMESPSGQVLMTAVISLRIAPQDAVNELKRKRQDEQEKNKNQE